MDQQFKMHIVKHVFSQIKTFRLFVTLFFSKLLVNAIVYKSSFYRPWKIRKNIYYEQKKWSKFFKD